MRNSAHDRLPPNWAKAKLSEVAQIVRGVAFPKEAKRSAPSDGLIACLRTANVQSEVDWEDLWYIPEAFARRPEQRIQLYDILISTANSLELVGKVAQVTHVPHNATLGAFISLIRIDPQLDPKFLFFQLASSEARERLRQTASTTTNISNISTQKLADLEILLAPLAEQNRIAAEVEKYMALLDAAIASLRRIQINLKRYRASVLKAACEGQLVPSEAELAELEGREYEPAAKLLERILHERWLICARNQRYKEPKPAKSDNLPLLPKGWIWASVESLSTKVVDGVHKKPDYVETGVPFVTVRNLTAGPAIDFTRLKYVSEENHREFTKRADPQKGDLLISKDGTLGVVRAVRTDREFSIFVSVALIKPILRELTNFFEIALASPQVQAQMVPKGSGLQHIHLEDLREDCIPLPPLAEQARIVNEVHRRLSLIDDLSNLIEHNLIRGERFRQSILSSAFGGRLATQDPSDEPASVLLERIRKVKQQESHERPTRRRSSRPAPEGRPDVARGVSPGSDAPHIPEPRRGGILVVASEDAAPTGLTFTDLPREGQIDAVWESLFGLGTLVKDDAVRTAADDLRGQGLVNFQRLQQGGPLYNAIETAIEQGLRMGDFDRPKRGHLRAVLRDPRSYAPETWTFCLLESFDHQTVEEEEAPRAAAEWARENMGLEYGRLRENGVILQGLRAALEEAIRRGEVERIGPKQIRRLSL